MDADIFDALTRDLFSRRSLFAFLAAGAGSRFSPGPAEAKKKNKKKRCQRNGTCGPSNECREGTDCTTGECCCAENVFVRCPHGCNCTGNENFCCAGTEQVPASCPLGPSPAEAFCCPEASVCGDFCCDPNTERCLNGACSCRPENACGTHCCDPRYFTCNAAKGLCECILPDKLDCPAGSGGFSRIRRVP